MYGDTRQKYVRLKKYDQVIIFPQGIEHSAFKHLEPVSAGFCSIGDGMITCYGRSISLNLYGKEDDSYIATKQVFGDDAAEELL